MSILRPAPAREGRSAPAGAPGAGAASGQGRIRRPARSALGMRRPPSARILSLPSRLTMWGGLGVGLVVYAVFGIAPVLGNIAISLTDYSGLAGSSTTFSGFSNYVDLVTSQRPGFISSLIATVFFVVGVTVVQNVIGIALAHRLQGQGMTANLLRILAFLPIVLGVTVVGLIWLLLFDPSDSPGTAIFGAIGVHSAFFGSDGLAMPLVITVQVWQNLGFTMVVFIGGLKAIPREIYEAASMDGVSGWRRFRAITWPLMAPTVSVNVLFAVVGSFTTYNLIYVLTDGQFGTDTLGMLAFNSAFGTSANLGFGAAITVVLLVVTIVIALPLSALLRARERRILA